MYQHSRPACLRPRMLLAVEGSLAGFHINGGIVSFIAEANLVIALAERLFLPRVSS